MHELFYDNDIIDIKKYLLFQNKPKPVDVFDSMEEERKIIEDLRNNKDNFLNICPIVNNVFVNKTNPIINKHISDAVKEKILKILNIHIKDELKRTYGRDHNTVLELLNPCIAELWDYIKNKKKWHYVKIIHRLYENQNLYDKAIEVLTYKIENSGTINALDINNLGYDYYLKEQWAEACVFFIKASELFKKYFIENNSYNDYLSYINTIVNRWLCEVEIANNLNDLKKITKEMNELKKSNYDWVLELSKSTEYWHKRKPFILQAKIFEKQGHLNKAIKCVNKALGHTKGLSVFFQEKDLAYKVGLEEKLKK